MMAQSLQEALYNAVKETVPETRVAIAFSGGIDSSLLAKICDNVGKEVALVTVGFPGSHDIKFSKEIADLLDLEHHLVKLDSKGFDEDLARVTGIIRCGNTSHIENCIAYLNIAKSAIARNTGLVLSANGCDELFCGYSAYRTLYNEGKDAIMNLMEEKLSNEYVLMKEISLVMQHYNVHIRQPFMSQKFVSFAKSIPLQYKIRGADDMMRKHILREVALAIGVPAESAMKPKKALQYGSSIHKNLKKTMKKHEA